MNSRFPTKMSALFRAFRTVWLWMALSLLALGCNLSQENQTETAFTFDRLTDSLKGFDTVIIVLKSPTGETIDVVFNAKVNDSADLRLLKAPHWQGGQVIVSITGIKNGAVVYKVDTYYEPGAQVRGEVIVFVSPNGSLTSMLSSLSLLIGDSLSLPPVNVFPSNLADKTLEWNVSTTGILALGIGSFKAVEAGECSLVVRLKSNPSVKLSIPVMVSASGSVPQSVSMVPDSLEIAADGAPGFLTAEIVPLAAPAGVNWTSDDLEIASVDSTGRVQGKRRGDTRVWAASKVRPTVRAAARVHVTGEVPVERISFLLESLELFQNGPSDTLIVTVFPPAANPNMIFTISDLTKASVQKGRISGIATGELTVIAASAANPELKDTLYVKVVDPVPAQKVSFTKDSLTINVDSAPESLVVSVTPLGANPAVTFTLSDPNKATLVNGKLTGKAAGMVTVIAASVATPAVQDTLYVKILGPIAVEKITFPKDSLTILVGSAPESLVIEVTPPGANPAVTFTVSDPLKATVQNGKISGTAAGTVSVVATSVAYPNIKATLNVKITVPVLNDTTPPGQPVVTVTPSGPTRDLRPVWKWTSGGGGAGTYQISLDKTLFDSTATTLSVEQHQPGSNLTTGLHILYVRERDDAGNWSKAGSAQVEIDTTGPALPKLVGTSPTSTLPRWTWSSGGNGGAGMYRSRLVDGIFPAGAPESRDSTYALLSATSGTTYTLFVQERDAAGNWSPTASRPIKYDLTKPTVTILAPAASGVFVIALDTVWISGTTTGPNGIAKLEYSLDGGAATTLVVGANGAWTLAGLRVTNAKTTQVRIFATDILGNTGEAEIGILRDSDPPLPPATLSTPSSPTNVTSATWTWAPGSDGTAGSGLNGKYQWKLNSAATWTQVSVASATATPLTEGINTISVQEQDKAGNWSASATSTVTLDTKVPDAVSFSGQDGSYTEDPTPTWTWSPSLTNPGVAGAYVLKLGTAAEFDWTTTSYTPPAQPDNATTTLTVRQRDQVPGVLGVAKSFSYKVKVNPAGTPTVTSQQAGLLDGGLTKNPGFKWTSGGGGNGKYRLRLNTETTYRINGVAQTTWTLPTNSADGIYAVHVSEQDTLMRWGNEGSFSINLDRTGPVYSEVYISGKAWVLRDGFITNAPSLDITYKADGVTKPTFNCDLKLNNANNLCSVTNSDAAGNSSTLIRNVVRRSNVVFFTPSGAGLKDGSSWEDAAGNLLAQIEKAGSEGKDFWLGTGTYGNIDYAPGQWVNMYGGFNAGATPTDLAGRTQYTSAIGGISAMGSPGGTYDGIKFLGGLGLGTLGSAATPANFVNCQFKGRIELNFGSAIIIKNSEMSDVTGFQPIAIGSGCSLTWDGGTITRITPNSDDPVINNGGTAIFKGTVSMSGNLTTQTAQIFNNGDLQLKGVLAIESASNVTCTSGYIYNTGGTCGN